MQLNPFLVLAPSSRRSSNLSLSLSLSLSLMLAPVSGFSSCFSLSLFLLFLSTGFVYWDETTCPRRDNEAEKWSSILEVSFRYPDK